MGQKLKKLMAIFYTVVKIHDWKRSIIDKKSKDILVAIIWDNIRSGLLGGALLQYLTDEKSDFRIPELDLYENTGCQILVCKYDRSIENRYTRYVLEHSQWRKKYRIVDIRSLGTKGDSKDGILCYPSDMEGIVSNLDNIGLHKIAHYKFLFAEIGKQYLDIFKPSEKEVIIDAGSYDGMTDVKFVEWAGENCKIYAFEPIEENQQHIKECINRYDISDNVKIFPYAVGSSEKDVYFIEGEDSSHIIDDISSQNTVCVKQVRIDDVINKEDKITFIKMDIEGSELDALKGASDTIKRNSPKLAICIYHKIKDLYEIPSYILSLNPQYRFMVRHYTSFLWETVLYASCNDDDFIEL